MILTPEHPEVDHRTMKLAIGAIALSMASLTSWLSEAQIASISASYHQGGWAQSIFVGYLFAIAALLLAHNGRSRTELVLSKLASVAALGVALFPCGCDLQVTGNPKAHWISAAIMFIVLAQFCKEFRRRAQRKGYPQADARAALYAACGVAILLAMCAMAVDQVAGNVFSSRLPRFTFYSEAVALTAFGASWLTASRVIPGLTRADERFSPLRENNPA